MNQENEWARSLKVGDKIVVVSGDDRVERIKRKRSKVRDISLPIIWVNPGISFSINDDLIYRSGFRWWRLVNPTSETLEAVQKEEENSELNYQVGHGIQHLFRSWEVTPLDVPTVKLEYLLSRVLEIKEALFELNGEVFED